MKNILKLFVLVILVTFYSCLAKPDSENISGITPDVLIPATENTTVYNNQEIVYFRVKIDPLLENIDSVNIYSGDTLLATTFSYNESGDFADIEINQKLEPGTYRFIIQFSDNYAYKSEPVERTITVVTENIPEPEIEIMGLEDGEISYQKEISLTFNTSPYKFTDTYSYALEANDILDYNYISANGYSDLDTEAYLYLLEEKSENSIYDNDGNYRQDGRMDIDNVQERETVNYNIHYGITENVRYTLYMISNNGWVKNYYSVSGLTGLESEW